MAGSGVKNRVAYTIEFYPEERFEINFLAGFWDLIAYLSKILQPH